MRVWAKGEGYSRQKALNTERWLESGAEVGKDARARPCRASQGRRQQTKSWQAESQFKVISSLCNVK